MSREPTAEEVAEWWAQQRAANPPKPAPEAQGLFVATLVTFGVSLLFAPVAIAPAIMGIVLTGRGRVTAGIVFIVLSLLILAGWILYSSGRIGIGP